MFYIKWLFYWIFIPLQLLHVVQWRNEEILHKSYKFLVPVSIEKSLKAYTRDGNCSNKKNCENYDFVVEESRYTSIWIALGFSRLDWEWNSGSISQPPTHCGLHSPMDQRGQASTQSHHRLCGGKWILSEFCMSQYKRWKTFK